MQPWFKMPTAHCCAISANFFKKYDGFKHPRSSDERQSLHRLCFNDGWMNSFLEASPRPGTEPLSSTNSPTSRKFTSLRPRTPTLFRHELWNATTNGEYPSVSYASLQNEANVKGRSNLV